ncbi:MAG TPA: Xaa-Pro peptidase family protein [Thermodesulfobacteriota bacterium]|nr:Xaa-Pro peptidase family protein [Thermodesulfobacteriota bacterium]
MNIFGSSFNYERRLDQVRKLMDEREIDAVLVHLWPNQYYLSGMYQHLPWYPVEVCEHTETPLIVFRDQAKDPVFLITWLTGNGLKEGTWIKDVRIVDKEPFGKLSWWEYTAECLKEKGVAEGTIGIEEDVCVLSTFRKLQLALPKARFKGADEIFQLVRMVKEPEEISLIKESVLIAEAGLKAGKEAAKVGALESEIQKAAEIEMKRRGAIREVETMVQSGIRTANHRAFGANWKRIEEGDLVMMDIGCVYKGYGSDLTRTWVVGKPTEVQKKIARHLDQVHKKILAVMKPGVMLGDIFALGRQEMRNLGYITDKAAMPANGSGLGGVTLHGIGLGPMHDPPHVEDKDVKLESGMTLAVAGGVRHEKFTIRFEDDVVVVPGGIELINRPSPWEL